MPEAESLPAFVREAILGVGLVLEAAVPEDVRFRPEEPREALLEGFERRSEAFESGFGALTLARDAMLEAASALDAALLVASRLRFERLDEPLIDGFGPLALELGFFAWLTLAREAMLDAGLDLEAALLVAFRLWLDRLAELLIDGFDRLALELGFFAWLALVREAMLDLAAALDLEAALLVAFRLWLDRLAELLIDGFDRLALAFFDGAALAREAMFDLEAALDLGLDRLALADGREEFFFGPEARLACFGAERFGAERFTLDPAEVLRLMFETLPRC